MTVAESAPKVIGALRRLVAAVPEIAEELYWARTAALCYEQLGHWSSLDIDLHSMVAGEDIGGVVQRIRAAEGVRSEEDHLPLRWRGRIMEQGKEIGIDVLSSLENAAGLVRSVHVPGLMRDSLDGYIRKKVECIQTRLMPKDWWHLRVLCRRSRRLDEKVMQAIRTHADPIAVMRQFERIVAMDVSDLRLSPREVVSLRAFYQRVAAFVVDMARKDLRGA